MSSTKKPLPPDAVPDSGDVVEKVPFMKAHDQMKVPPEGLLMKLSNQELELLLALLSKTHESFVNSIRDPESSKETRALCYNTALRIENFYSNIFKQLKLDKPERPDLH